MIMQGEKIEQLEKQIQEMQEEAKQQEIKIKELGSIAEASLSLNNVFESAQAAADMYLEQAKKRAEEIVSEAEAKIGSSN